MVKLFQHFLWRYHSFDLLLNRIRYISCTKSNNNKMLIYSQLICSINIRFQVFSNNYYYIPLDSRSRSLALSSFILFISLMQSAKGAQFLNIAFLSPLFETAAATVAVFGTVIVFLTSIYYEPLNFTLALKF